VIWSIDDLIHWWFDPLIRFIDSIRFVRIESNRIELNPSFGRTRNWIGFVRHSWPLAVACGPARTTCHTQLLFIYLSSWCRLRTVLDVLAGSCFCWMRSTVVELFPTLILLWNVWQACLSLRRFVISPIWWIVHQVYSWTMLICFQKEQYPSQFIDSRFVSKFGWTILLRSKLSSLQIWSDPGALKIPVTYLPSITSFINLLRNLSHLTYRCT